MEAGFDNDGASFAQGVHGARGLPQRLSQISDEAHGQPELALRVLRFHYELLLDYVDDWEDRTQPGPTGWRQAEQNLNALNRSLGYPMESPGFLGQSNAEIACQALPFHIWEFCSHLQSRIERNPGGAIPGALEDVKDQLKLVLSLIVQPAESCAAPTRPHPGPAASEQPPSSPAFSDYTMSDASFGAPTTIQSVYELAAFPNKPPSELFSPLFPPSQRVYEPTLRGGPDKHPNNVSDDLRGSDGVVSRKDSTNCSFYNTLASSMWSLNLPACSGTSTFSAPSFAHGSRN